MFDSIKRIFTLQSDYEQTIMYYDRGSVYFETKIFVLYDQTILYVLCDSLKIPTCVRPIYNDSLRIKTWLV